jgi:hypothetical protein
LTLFAFLHPANGELVHLSHAGYRISQVFLSTTSANSSFWKIPMKMADVIFPRPTLREIFTRQA